MKIWSQVGRWHSRMGAAAPQLRPYRCSKLQSCCGHLQSWRRFCEELGLFPDRFILPASANDCGDCFLRRVGECQMISLITVMRISGTLCLSRKSCHVNVLTFDRNRA